MKVGAPLTVGIVICSELISSVLEVVISGIKSMVTIPPICVNNGTGFITGGISTTVKFDALKVEWHPTVTSINPLVVPAGTCVSTLVVVLADTDAVRPLNLTRLLAGMSLKLVPVIVTIVPMGPLVGEKEVIVGANMEKIGEQVVPTVIPFTLAPVAVALFATVIPAPWPASFNL